MWGGVELLDAEFQCRHFFLQSRLAEDAWDTNFCISQVGVDVATCERLEKLYKGEKTLTPDGFQFIHQAAKYCGGLSPLSLVCGEITTLVDSL